MSLSKKNPQFGQKGVGDSAISLAQSLLTGKPLARTPAKDRTPKLKPRPKPRFGRKTGEDNALPPSQASARATGWKLGLGVLLALGLGLQVLSVMLTASPIESVIERQNPL